MTDGGQLFDRRVRVQVADLALDGFDVTFEITKSLSAKTPNKAELRIWNLNADHRKHLQELEHVFVSIEAGYASGTSLVYKGDLRDVVSVRDRSDWITSITSDAARRARKKRLVKSFAPGSSVADIIAATAKAMGINMGNAEQAALAAKIAGTGAAKFFNGYAVAGAVDEELDRLARSTNLEWSIQDDTLQFLEYGKPMARLAVRLTPDTGLIGSPEPGNKGIAEVRCLLIPDLYPGRRVEVQAEHVKGFFRVEVTKHTGSTFGDEWYVDMQLKSEQRRAST
jgi:hypothetical protein